MTVNPSHSPPPSQPQTTNPFPPNSPHHIRHPRRPANLRRRMGHAQDDLHLQAPNRRRMEHILLLLRRKSYVSSPLLSFFRSFRSVFQANPHPQHSRNSTKAPSTTSPLCSRPTVNSRARARRPIPRKSAASPRAIMWAPSVLSP